MVQALNSRTGRWMLAAAGAALLMLSASCGGGASIALPDNTPAPGTADLNGQLVQGSGGRAVSAAGDGLSGVLVSLIDSASGQQAASDTTDPQGRFEFKGVPSGEGMLVKVEFTSPQDLDGDGQPDDIELFFPVSLADQSVSELKQQIALDDTDGDSHMDCVDVRSDLTDSNGRHESDHRQHQRRGNDQTVADTNNDGQFDQNDQHFPDVNGDNLPDGREHLGSVEAHGAIEAITDTSITVATVQFAITDATHWAIGDNRNATAADFSVGMPVLVHGFTTADGVLVAHRVRARGNHAGVNPGDDNNTGNDDGSNGGDDPSTGNGDGRPNHDGDNPGDVDNGNDGQPDNPGDDPGVGDGGDSNGGSGDDPGDVDNGDDPSGGDPDNSGDDPGVGNGGDPNGGGDDPGDVGNGDDPSGGDPGNDGGDPDVDNGGDSNGGDPGDAGDGSGDSGGGDGDPNGGDPDVP